MDRTTWTTPEIKYFSLFEKKENEEKKEQVRSANRTILCEDVEGLRTMSAAPVFDNQACPPTQQKGPNWVSNQ
jgi:hypothetical protein